ncbi:clan AA aspartic protease [Rhodoferax sp. 4810]|uniref:Clan AA aspartic protease n=1 Tax=Thiospirillum jenense TaxID=1653858 RepID=A0A839HCX9_9GAMM|nr:clan AA aspartic protease [Thiospirillum jenense]MBB1073100.1 clan AA aspartic protease [Rhodoferax jenense]MBB1125047.1 clan AA aspartic protease [Thiospirillum jenense]
MGLSYVTVTVSNLAKTQPAYAAEFLVDTGAIDCLASGVALHAAGIMIEGKDVYELADGSVIEYPYGFARVAFMGAETVTQIIFGPDDCEPLLGVVALENTGIGVDPATRSLRKMSAKPLK